MPSPTSAAATISATTGSCRASSTSAPTRFNDFVDVAEGLIAAGFTKAGNIAIEGRSAGGELMGAVANSDPELWGAVVAGVPFVDVLNTMLDDTLPLTPGEWPEWGNPITDKAAFELIRSYSPYDNVQAQAYPPMLITGGLNDPRVTYWEPAKWAARLRATKTDDNLLLLKINMGAGHGGKSGRWDHLQGSRRGLCVRPDAGGRVTRPTFEMAFTARAEHIDELGHVNNAVWVQWIQEVAVAHWDAVADPAHKDAYFWVDRAARDRLSPRRAGRRPGGRAHLGRRSAEGRAVRPPHGIHRQRRPDLRPRAHLLGDHRQGLGPPDPRAARGSGAVHGRGVSSPP